MTTYKRRYTWFNHQALCKLHEELYSLKQASCTSISLSFVTASNIVCSPTPFPFMHVYYFFSSLFYMLMILYLLVIVLLLWHPLLMCLVKNLKLRISILFIICWVLRYITHPLAPISLRLNSGFCSSSLFVGKEFEIKDLVRIHVVLLCFLIYLGLNLVSWSSTKLQSKIFVSCLDPYLYMSALAMHFNNNYYVL